MERLSGQDAMFLYQETPTAHMHIAGIGVFDPSTATEPVTLERVIAAAAERMHLVPSMRRRLARVPFDLHHPIWVDEPNFDLEHHIRSATVPAPGGPRELAALAADISSLPLDRSRPLWEMHVLDGLEDGNTAVVSKTHHAAIDGVGSVDLSIALMDLTPDPTPIEPPTEEWKPERIPSDLELVGYAINSLSRQPFGLARFAARTARSFVDAAPWRRRVGAGGGDGSASAGGSSGAEERARRGAPIPFAAPRTSINRPLTPHRSFSFFDRSLDDFKLVGKGLGGTVNDVVLAISAGALRRLFQRRGERVDRPLVANVPVSVRGTEQQGAMGNQISMMLTSLATDISDPVERLHAISESTAAAKETQNAIGARAIQELSELAFPRLMIRAARTYSSLRLARFVRPPFNLTISNVPGPPFALYSIGSRMVASYPMGPLMEGTGLNITVGSYMGTMSFGLHACREAVPDPWWLAGAMCGSLDELMDAAG